MNDREKLIMLLGDDTCHRECSECEYHENEKACIRYLKESMADHLLANGVTVQKWIPVTERLPEIVKTTKAHRNVYRRTDRVQCACLQTNGKRMVKEGYAEFFNDYPEPNWKIPGTIHSVTHWMPMPQPPEDGGAEDD